MKKIISIGIVSLVVIGGFLSLINIEFKIINATGPTYVSGFISSNATWTLTNSPYIVIDDVIVESNITLTIEPGVMIKFDSGRELVVDGALIANGTNEDNIIFTSNSSLPSRGDWGQILFRDGSQDSLCSIVNSSIYYATYGIHMESATPRIEKCIYSQNDVGVFIQNTRWERVDLSKLDINNNTEGLRSWLAFNVRVLSSRISNNSWYGVNGGVYLEESVVEYNGNWGIYSSCARLTLYGTRVVNNGGGGIFGDYGALAGILEVSNSKIEYNNGPGIEGGDISIKHSTIRGNGNNGLLGSEGFIHFSNILDNVPYDFDTTGMVYTFDVYAENNWWGTTNMSLIDEHIYDYYDDYNLGKVIYQPFLIGPVPSLRQCHLIPTSGDVFTHFNYTVIYSDIDNNPPSYVNVSVDGTHHPMIETDPIDTNYTDGKEYYYNTTITTLGNHAYQFFAFNGFNHISSEIFSGPDVIKETTLPTLTDVTAIPDPQEVNSYVNISANVSDNVNVDTVSIGIIDPNGGIVGNFTMSCDPVDDRYYKNKNYSIVGIYQFIIWANDTSDNWNFSSGQFTMQDTTPPATPTGLIVTDVPNDEGGTLSITWDANTEPDLDHYTLYSNKTGSWVVVAEIPAGTEYYVDTGLTDGTVYYYNISASDNLPNESPQSATANGVPADNLPPATPTGLTVTDVPNDEGGALNITWDLNSDDTVVYSLYSNKSGSWQFLVNVTHPQNWYVDTGLANNVKYYYKISVNDEVPNESPLSDAAYGIPRDNLPPTTPTGLAVTSLHNGDLNIAWNLNTDDTQTYSIYSNKTGTWTLLMNITHPQNWYVDTGLTSNTTYYYRISAWDEVPLESSKSEVIHGVSSLMGTISGVVKDKDSNPIEGANIVIYVAGTTDNPVASTTTNSNGEYSIEVPPDTYDVKIEKSDYETQWEKDVEVTADQTATTDSTLPLTSDILGDYWWVFLLVVIIVITVVIIGMSRRKKGKELEQPPGFEDTTDEVLPPSSEM